jgi:hypothetical protein
MESTPLEGVDTKKAMVALLDAPSLLMDSARGIIPHEQTGSGMPNRAAFIVDHIPLFAKCFFITLSPSSVCIRPAKKKPKIKYGLISTKSL